MGEKTKTPNGSSSLTIKDEHCVKDLTQRRQQREEVLSDGSFKVQNPIKSFMKHKTTKNPCFEPCIWGSLWWGILVVSWLLLVCLLLVSVSGAVLDIGWAWTQSIQVTTILCIINVILKKHLQWQWCYSQYHCCIRCHFKRFLVIFNMHSTLMIFSSWRHTSLILKKAIPVRSESEPAWCWGPILSSSSCSATSCRPPCTSHDRNQAQIPSIHTDCYKLE